MTPPEADGFVWFREDRVIDAMQAALNAAVKMHGNAAKAVAWDVRSEFRKQLKEPA